MKENIEPDYLWMIELVKKEMEKRGIRPDVRPIRGGTDGARLSFMGLPCPNICTGGHNFHGRFEYCVLESMEVIVQVLIGLCTAGLDGKC
jgi:tripeptide aminopeptidase